MSRVYRLSLWLLIVSLVALLGWVVLFWEPPAKPGGHAGLEVSEVPVGGDFTLDSYRGPVSLADYRGRVVVVYFGYTWCPDICPTSLGYLTAALNELDSSELSSVQAFFVSVDPERDTLERLKAYGEYFHPNILGITGRPETVREVATRYGAAYAKAEQKSETDYVVDHSAALYLVDREGRLADVLVHGTPPREIYDALKKLI